MEKDEIKTYENRRDIKELDASQEKELVHSNRIVVFGKRNDINLADKIGKKIDTAEKQLDVYGVSMVDNIEDGFYGRLEGLHVVEFAPKKLSVIDRLKKFVLRSQIKVKISSIESALPPIDSIPMGVIMFPEMRDYDPRLAAGGNMRTPFEGIERLCVENGVKFVRIEPEENEVTDIKLEQSMKSFKEEL